MERIEPEPKKLQRNAAAMDETYIVVTENELKNEPDDFLVLNDTNSQNIIDESVVFVQEKINEAGIGDSNHNMVNNIDLYIHNSRIKLQE